MDWLHFYYLFIWISFILNFNWHEVSYEIRCNWQALRFHLVSFLNIRPTFKYHYVRVMPSSESLNEKPTKIPNFSKSNDLKISNYSSLITDFNELTQQFLMFQRNVMAMEIRTACDDWPDRFHLISSLFRFRYLNRTVNNGNHVLFRYRPSRTKE